LEDDSYHEGLVGLIAGRLKGLYHSPSFVFTYHDGVYKGSARSIDGVDLMELLNKEKALLLGFGGHKSAAGLSIDPDKFDDFVVDINKNANLTDELRTKRVDVDMAFTVEDISEDLIDGIAKLKPYGMGFPKPRFGLSNFVADLINTGSPFRGTDQKTVRLVDKNKFTVIMFKNPEAFQKVLPKFQQGKVIKVIGSPSTNLFNNVVSLQFQVEDNLMF
jgi:single-stranded-DNA-specific exonuclease